MMNDALPALRRHDADLIELVSGDGLVLVSPSLQGRVFCAIGKELLHRLDLERLAHPVAGEFNNLGGNSLWPAPEGGPLAFNYLPGSDQWVVQSGIAETTCRVAPATAREAAVEKVIVLRNRKGTSCRMRFARQVMAGAMPGAPAPERLAALGLRAVGYDCLDTLEPLEALTSEALLLAAWSLEQFPGGAGVTAFAKTSSPDRAINFSFYGMPERGPEYRKDYFTLSLDGSVKFQIGVACGANPLLLGALDRARGLLLLRQTERQAGVYFNIADNDQPAGPFSAADMYSVFNGGPLDFFELETIGAMQVEGGRVGACTLRSKTWLAQGPVEILTRLLAENWGIDLRDSGGCVAPHIGLPRESA